MTVARHEDRSRFAVALFLGLVAVLTVVGARKPGVAVALAASPARLSHGRIWLLVSSGLLAEHPIGASIVSFVLLAVLTLAVCGTRTFWWAAAWGHIGSTVVVYGVIGAARLAEPRAFSNVFASRDYGVSAIAASWLGAVATVGWRIRGKSVAGRFAIAFSCLAVGLFAYSARPGLTIIASEHVLAFVLGVAVATRLLDPVRDIARLRNLGTLVAARSTRILRRPPRPVRQLDPVLLCTVTATVVVVGGAALPSALAGLAESIAPPRSPSVARCVGAWNHTPAWHLFEISNAAVLVATGHEYRQAGAQKRARIDYCSYVFTAGNGLRIAVVGRWYHGRIVSWSTRLGRPAELPTNAVAASDGLLRLARPHDTQRA